MSGQRKYFGFDIDIKGTTGRILIGNGYLKVFVRKKSRFYSGFYSLEKIRTISRPSKTKYFTNMINNTIDYLEGKSEIESTLESLEMIAKEIKKWDKNSHL